MEQSFSLEPGQKLFLSAFDARLYVHTLQNERFHRPTLLCTNYESDLSGAIYNNTLYYSYLNKEHSLIVRRLGESSILLRLDSTSTVSYSKPQLVCFADSLLLFYLEQSANGYEPKFRNLFTDTVPVSIPYTVSSALSVSSAALPDLYPTQPTFHLLPADNNLYIFLTSDDVNTVLRYDTSLSPEILCTGRELTSLLHFSWKTEKAELTQQISFLQETLTQTQTTLEEKTHENLSIRQLLLNQEVSAKAVEIQLFEKSAEINRLEALLTEQNATIQTNTEQLSQAKETIHHLEQVLEQTRHQLADSEQNSAQTKQYLTDSEYAHEQTQLLLERAKIQYGELMDVAEQYRQEALKWYGKFTDRH